MTISSANIQSIVRFLRAELKTVPKIAVVLGSGLGELAKEVKSPIVIPYERIPYFPKTKVEGHAGELVKGNLNGVPVLFMRGRFHYYEGHDIDTIQIPVRVIGSLKVKNLILTNAAGSLKKSARPGSLMAMKGHIDFTFIKEKQLPRKMDSEKFHSGKLMRIAQRAARKTKVALCTGIYVWTLGPSYETPAEIKVIRTLGGDAVGMSTVPEILEGARHHMNILTISCLTNYAAGITPHPLTHEEVIRTAGEVSEKFKRLMREIVFEIHEGENGRK